MFFPHPVPGQTIESRLRGRDRLPAQGERAAPGRRRAARSSIGNCQGGWALMMLAALAPDEIGPILLAGSPLSYWAGVAGKNPMRYMGGLLGGSWPASLPADLGDGKFDGAHLVNNFESLDPANTLLDEALQPVFEGRHGARALPPVRALVGRPLPHEPRRDRLDRPEPVRRQQAVGRRGRIVRRQAPRRPAQHPVADHRVRVAGATTSRRRSRRWTGSPTSTAASTTSASTSRRSSTACTRRPATWACSCRRASRGARPPSWRARSISIDTLPPGLYEAIIEDTSPRCPGGSTSRAAT